MVKPECFMLFDEEWRLVGTQNGTKEYELSVGNQRKQQGLLVHIPHGVLEKRVLLSSAYREGTLCLRVLSAPALFKFI